jgi:hypothetical protein
MAKTPRETTPRSLTEILHEPNVLDNALPRIDFGDSWVTPLLPGDSDDVAVWNHAIFSLQPAWVETLMGAWHGFLRAIRFPVSDKDPSGVGFPVLARTATEVLSGEDSASLSFRCRVAVQDGEVTVTTIVQVLSSWGRVYWSFVRPFHPILIKATIAGVPSPLTPETGRPTGRTAGATLVQPDSVR